MHLKKAIYYEIYLTHNERIFFYLMLYFAPQAHSIFFAKIFFLTTDVIFTVRQG